MSTNALVKGGAEVFSQFMTSEDISKNVRTAQDRAALLLAHSQLKTAYSQKDYKRIWELFLGASENMNDELKASFASWLIGEIQVCEDEIGDIKEEFSHREPDQSIGEYYDGYKRSEKNIKAKIQEVREAVCSQDFKSFFSILDSQSGEDILIFFLKADTQGNSNYSYTQGVRELLESIDIDSLDAERIVDTLIDLGSRAVSNHASAHFFYGMGELIDREQRITEHSLILKTSVGKNFDVQEAVMKSIEPCFSYFFHFLLTNYFDEIDWDPVMKKAQEKIDSYVEDDDEHYEEYTSKDYGEDLLKYIAKGPNIHFRIRN